MPAGRAGHCKHQSHSPGLRRTAATLGPAPCFLHQPQRGCVRTLKIRTVTNEDVSDATPLGLLPFETGILYSAQWSRNITRGTPAMLAVARRRPFPGGKCINPVYETSQYLTDGSRLIIQEERHFQTFGKSFSGSHGLNCLSIFQDKAEFVH